MNNTARLKVSRQSVDLSGYPDLVVIYLGMRANSLRGLKTLFGLGPQIKKSVAAGPDGLLLHENIFFSFFPPHFGMRQYWRDFESLERWTRELPHQAWWRDFHRDPGGTSFWHETYAIGGGFEALYGNMKTNVGMMKFAPRLQPHGSLFTARRRLGKAGEPGVPVLAEAELEETGAAR